MTGEKSKLVFVVNRETGFGRENRLVTQPRIGDEVLATGRLDYGFDVTEGRHFASWWPNVDDRCDVLSAGKPRPRCEIAIDETEIAKFVEKVIGSSTGDELSRQVSDGRYQPFLFRLTNEFLKIRSWLLDDCLSVTEEVTP